MIRAASQNDVGRMLEMGARFVEDGPYRNETIDPVASARFAFGMLRDSNGQILVDEEDGKVVGLIAFLVYPHYFTGQPTGIEIMWYVEPEFRHSMIGIALLRAAQRRAKEMGAVKMQFTAPTVEVGRAYEMLGYKQTEVAYQKEI